MPTPAIRPDFRCAEGFSRNGPTRKWLRRLNYDLQPLRVNGEISPEKHLVAIELMLEGDAHAWADKKQASPESILQANGIEPPELNKDHVIKLLELEYSNPKRLMRESLTMEECMQTLAQRKDEDQAAYYRRGVEMLRKIGEDETTDLLDNNIDV